MLVALRSQPSLDAGPEAYHNPAAVRWGAFAPSSVMAQWTPAVGTDFGSVETKCKPGFPSARLFSSVWTGRKVDALQFGVSLTSSDHLSLLWATIITDARSPSERL